jgi:hypothetical protein
VRIARSLRTTYEHAVQPVADDRNRWTKRARVAPPVELLLVVHSGRLRPAGGDHRSRD